LQALSEAHDSDWTQLWDLNERNLAPEIADVITPFHADLRPADVSSMSELITGSSL
jgi:hypothetical protein